jgi:segregation and condensation protein B
VDDVLRRLEALLFAAGRPCPTAALALALGLTEAELEAHLGRLGETLAGRGLELASAGGRHTLTVARDLEGFVAESLGVGREGLGAAALEVLALVAWHQPVDRHRLEELRGVRCDRALALLRAEGLIEPAGRAEGPGRPVLWRTTPEFLLRFGLESLEAFRRLAGEEA